MSLIKVMSICILGLFFIIITFFRIYKKWNSKNFFDTWVDGLIVNLLATLIVLILGVIFKKEIFEFFQRPRVALSSSCVIGENTRKFIYECNVEIENETEANLSAYPIIIDSSKEFSNFSFVDCNPTNILGNNTNVVSQTKASGEVTCAFRIDMVAFGKIKFRLRIVGDQNVPVLDLRQ